MKAAAVLGAFALLASCSLLTPSPRGVTLTNDTASTLSLTLAPREAQIFHQDGPFSLDVGGTVFLAAEGPVHLDFQLDTGAETFDANTGYTEDYSAYTLRFFTSDGRLCCELIHRREGRRPIELINRAETSPSQGAESGARRR